MIVHLLCKNYITKLNYKLLKKHKQVESNLYHLTVNALRPKKYIKELVSNVTTVFLKRNFSPLIHMHIVLSQFHFQTQCTFNCTFLLVCHADLKLWDVRCLCKIT